ncbi:hypothetical protein GCM10010306_105000 [Streptomyces umbrinus]|uniref:transposase n=1 Tax=Streptomyces umbrinus TaxID=67370 RepID=UPI0016783F9C|nr:transposase [Streptomyces umbrinus]GHB93052.1 hypothetical protein GCM10010306_105000 [Streptomyces umbrinus]
MLSEFRDRMAQGDRADRLLVVMVDHLVSAGLVKRRGAVRTDSTHVLAAIRKLNRGELVTETLRAALEQLALADEHWLASLITANWADRYGRPAIYHRLPKGKAALEEYALQGGDPKSNKDRLSRRNMPRRAASRSEAARRPDPEKASAPWASMEIISPYDAEAHYSQKLTASGKKEWIGYRDHQSETCGDGPHVIVQVTTRPAGFTKADFTPNWEARTLTCPRGVTSHPWKATRGDGHERLSLLFPKPACRVCEARQECTGTTEDRGRHIILLPQPLQEIQTRVRREQETVQ